MYSMGEAMADHKVGCSQHTSERISRYPRVLIINEQFHTHKGGGITLSSLFAGWPRDNLAIASHLLDPPDWERCAHYYRVGRAEYKWRWPFGPLNPAGRSGPVVNIGYADAPPPDGIRHSTHTAITPARRVMGAARSLLGGPSLYAIRSLRGVALVGNRLILMCLCQFSK
jgi:hypothetical protein